MHPKMGTDTLKPDLPKRLYSAFVSLIDLYTGSLSLEAMFALYCWCGRETCKGRRQESRKLPAAVRSCLPVISYLLP